MIKVCIVKYINRCSSGRVFSAQIVYTVKSCFCPEARLGSKFDWLRHYFLMLCGSNN